MSIPRNVPNMLTVLRLAAVPVFVLLWRWSGDTAALLVFLAAACTDLIDGLLARLLDQRTRWGALADPVADKLLLWTALVCLGAAGRIAPWFICVLGARDSLQIAGYAGLRMGRLRHSVPPPLAPTRLGRASALLSAACVALELGGASSAAGVAALLAVECGVLSLLRYTSRWIQWKKGKMLES